MTVADVTDAHRRLRRLHHGRAVLVPRRRRGGPAAGRGRLHPARRGAELGAVGDGRRPPLRRARRRGHRVGPAGAAGPTTPFRILGAHTDSPGFKLKPKPTIGSHGWLQAGVEVYGGPLLNSWLDRELELAGRLVTRDGAEHLVRTGPFLRIPQLAIHLDRDVNDGLTLDRQRHTAPVFGVGDADAGRPARAPRRARRPRRRRRRRLRHPHRRHRGARAVRPRRRPLRRRPDGQPLLGPRRPARAARRRADRGAGHISVLAAFDHEELGSATRSGASGPFLADILTRIGAGLGADARAAAAGVRRLLVPLRRRRPRRAPELPRAARPGEPPGRPAAGRC